MFFAWWLDPWFQRKSNQALWDDVQANLYFLYSNGELIKEKHPQILPFDYASVSLVFDNIRFCFTRGREELNVSLSPRHAPMDVSAGHKGSQLRRFGSEPLSPPKKSIQQQSRLWESGNPAFFAGFPSEVEKSAFGLFHGASFPQPFAASVSLFILLVADHSHI